MSLAITSDVDLAISVRVSAADAASTVVVAPSSPSEWASSSRAPRSSSTIRMRSPASCRRLRSPCRIASAAAPVDSGRVKVAPGLDRHYGHGRCPRALRSSGGRWPAPTGAGSRESRRRDGCSAGRISTISGLPSVRVPVLSRTTVSTVQRRSRWRPPSTITPGMPPDRRRPGWPGVSPQQRHMLRPRSPPRGSTQVCRDDERQHCRAQSEVDEIAGQTIGGLLDRRARLLGAFGRTNGASGSRRPLHE